MLTATSTNIRIVSESQAISAAIFVEWATLLGKIMACFIMTGEIMGGENVAEIVQKPPIFPGHNFTCDFCSQNFS